jgi:anhydro-N-acetylmuramic acid kinase
MSGTSLDGVDLAHVQFHKNSNKWTFKILESETVPYSNEWVNILKSAVSFSKAELKARIKNTLNISSVISSFIENIILKI